MAAFLYGKWKLCKGKKIGTNLKTHRNGTTCCKLIMKVKLELKLLIKVFFIFQIHVVGAATGSLPEYVRYVKSVNINIQLIEGTTTGQIFPPYLTIEYGSVSLTDAQGGGSISVSRKIDLHTTYSILSHRSVLVTDAQAATHHISLTVWLSIIYWYSGSFSLSKCL